MSTHVFKNKRMIQIINLFTGESDHDILQYFKSM